MKDRTFESAEDLHITSRTISAEDLKNRIYKGGSLPQDDRFLPENEGGVFKYFLLSDVIDYRRKDAKFFPIVEVGDEIVAIAELEIDPRTENNLWIKFISVDPKHRGNRYASKLIEEMFKFAKERDCSLHTSIYSDDGWQKLKRLIHESSKRYGVKVIDPN